MRKSFIISWSNGERPGLANRVYTSETPIFPSFFNSCLLMEDMTLEPTAVSMSAIDLPFKPRWVAGPILLRANSRSAASYRNPPASCTKVSPRLNTIGLGLPSPASKACNPRIPPAESLWSSWRRLLRYGGRGVESVGGSL